ncbi:MAG: hypothetical protein LUD41_05450, partial [Phascolarctobacterium sp.]|nr:hypothetical protein [Phascolarctobacterium sp.]
IRLLREQTGGGGFERGSLRMSLSGKSDGCVKYMGVSGNEAGKAGIDVHGRAGKKRKSLTARFPLLK